MTGTGTEGADIMKHEPIGPAAAGGYLRFRPARGPRGLGCWIASPAAPRPGATPLVAVHGIARDARAQAAAYAPRAAAEGRTVIAPLFEEPRWTGYQRLAPNRADLALIDLLAELEGEGRIDAGPVDLAGFSGGAQFGHRFAMLYPTRIRRATFAAAGFWTFPDESPFPAGLGGGWGARLAAGLDRFLGLDLAVVVGGADTERDPGLRATKGIDARQGPNRVERARRFVAALAAEAARRGRPAPASFTLLPGLGHDFDDCAAEGSLVSLVFRA